MRRLFITSACTLVLSLLGTFGFHQNSFNLDILNSTDQNTTQVVRNVTDTENNQSLNSDNQTATADTAAKNTNKDISEVTPQVTASANGAKIVDTPTATKAPAVTSTPTATKAPVVTNTPAPTKAPAATSTPTATKAPAATSAPTATKAPVATAAPTVKPSTSNSASLSNYASEVLRLVNIERAKAGLSSYTTNQTITAAANKRANETSVSFSHTRPDGSGFSTVLQEFGISYRAAGENIAYGQRTPQEVVTGWMNSPGHRANILNANFNKIGIGVYQKNGVIYWTQEFTN